jgi:hypothetical protein
MEMCHVSRLTLRRWLLPVVIEPTLARFSVWCLCLLGYASRAQRAYVTTSCRGSYQCSHRVVTNLNQEFAAHAYDGPRALGHP